MAKQSTKISLARVGRCPPIENGGGTILIERDREIGLVRQGGGRAVAARALDQFTRAGYRAPEGPTPERLTKARGAAQVEKFTTTTEVSSGDVFKTVPIDMVRIKFSDDPFSQLCKNRSLDPKNPEVNLALGHAGLKFRAQWRLAGLDALRGVDPSRDTVSGSGGGLWATEASSDAFGEYKRALVAMPRFYHFTVEQIVLHDRGTEEIGRIITNYTDAKMARAIALDRLRCGLTALADLWGYLEPPENRHCAGN